jgi:hypothetical protein
MIKRTMIAALLGLAVASPVALAQDTRTPVFGPDRDAQRQNMSDEQKQAAQKSLDEYWATHNDNAPSYPFNP